MKKPTLQLALLTLLLVWCLGWQVALSSKLISRLLHPESRAQPIFFLKRFTLTIERVPPQYRGLGLMRGDEVVALNGIHPDGNDQIEDVWRSAHPGDIVSVTVKHNRPAQPELDTLAVPLRSDSSNATEWLLTLSVSVFLPISCLLVGFYIAFARPRDSLAWITLAMLATTGQVAGDVGPSLLSSPWREILYVYQPFLNTSWPLWLVLFSFFFPIPFEFILRKSWISWLLALPCIAVEALAVYGNFEQGRHLNNLAWLARREASIHTAEIVWFSLYVFAFFFFLGWKRRLLTARDARRRIRLMSIGCTVALLPTLPVFLSEAGIIPHLPFWLFTVCLSALVFFPITMAYVIVVQRAMDVRMVVRSGVQYAFASNGIRILQVGLSLLVFIETLRLAQEANRRVGVVIIAGIGIAVVASTRSVVRWIRGWMDKRFFREAYNAEMILTDLSSSVAGIRDVRALLETVTRRISESLHVPRIAVFLEQNGSYRPAYALGCPALEPVEFDGQRGVVGFLRRQLAPSKIYFGDPQNWIHGTPAAEQETLRQLDTQLLLPLSLKSRLLGMISLGGKQSEEPYSRADIQLLNAVAAQTGLALENAELTESVRHEIAQRERLDRELEIAREVQQRLFPQTLPEVSGLDFAGYCRPAEGVGGDYYDFIHLPDGCLGIAVGDVSGKGIAAALMMASLQASLRGQTIKPCDTLSEMIEHINRLVYDASADNRYATFFYAQYDPATRRLRYVNAGHNPPLVWHANCKDHTFIPLSEGGTVVGLFRDTPFLEAVVQLEPGDVVVAYTDGISEALNHSDEEYGEERLIEALRSCEARTAAEMTTYLLNSVDGFTAGAKQHDDMTLVVVRVH